VELFPAIDLRQGTAVRLVQGDFARQSDYGDPLALAERYAGAGARWAHVVDLDAARTGRPGNRTAVLAIARQGSLKVQAGGGVRRIADAEELLEGGVARVVLGTVAVTDPHMVQELAGRHGERVAVGIDHRGSGQDVALSGWEQRSGVTLDDMLDRLDGLSLGAVVVTAIERDGALSGPDLAGLRDVLERSPHPVVASGGVRSAGDLRALAALEARGRRLAGVVVGRALVDGSLSVEEAMAACAVSG
jgi:phosphoribosylformimino-5-aminoimidazole carboxamide ribotide isomerase